MNPVTRENQRTDGVTDRAGWDVAAAASDDSLVGFAQPFCVNRTGAGNTVALKIKSTEAFTATIFRLGYYGGSGARLLRALNGGQSFSAQAQPPCRWADEHETVDCANWTTTISYTPDPDVPSGVFVARLITTTGSNAGKGRLVPFVVRDDARTTDVLVQLPDVTWEAYNLWTDDPTHVHMDGPGAFYTPNGYGGLTTRASYNRPFTGSARLEGSGEPHDTVYGFTRFYENTYTVIRWLERIGVNVSYITGQEVARDYVRTRAQPARSLLRHATGAPRVFMTVGHDEYWSQEQRNNIDRARAAGVHMMFLAGNHMYWKVGWDAAGDAVVCEKPSNTVPRVTATHDTFTGLWTDGRCRPVTAAENARGPENASTGMISAALSDVRAGDVLTSPAEGQLRFWRLTLFGSGGSHDQNMQALAMGPIGNEWQHDVDNGARPAGLFHVSSTPMHGVSLSFGVGDFGRGHAVTSTHGMTIFRDQRSGALVFHGGTIDFGKALDGFRMVAGTEVDVDGNPASWAIQQGVVNLFADMGITQPETMPDFLWWDPPTWQPGPPTSQITSPAGPVPVNALVRVEGTAAPDAGAAIAAVEVSFADGQWHPAVGRDQWHYLWTPPHAGTFTVRSRAVDDWGRIEANGPMRAITVQPSPGFATSGTDYRTLWDAEDPATFAFQSDPAEVETGSWFAPAEDGVVDGVRFFRDAADTGLHYVNLWQVMASGTTLLASAVAPAPGGGASGWVEARFPRPIRVTGGGTYIAACHSESGFPFRQTPPAAQPLLTYRRPGYAYCPRDADGFVLDDRGAPDLSPSAGAPLLQAVNHYPVDPLFKPTAAVPLSLWPPDRTNPMRGNVPAGAATEFGTEFRCDVDAFVVAVRFFYKGAADPSAFTVALWGAPSNRTAIGAEPVPAADGWWEAAVNPPVPITAGALYVASYTSPASGHHAVTADYFRAGTVTTWPLHAHRGVSGEPGARPATQDDHACYFVDVVVRTRP